MAVENKENTRSSGKRSEDKKERRRRIITAIAFLVLILIIIILLLRSCSTGPDDPYGGTQGEWNVGDKRPEEPQDPSVIPENITFSGEDRYTVSSSKKEIELNNPGNNQANFVFTVTDAKTGKIIAKTGKVQPGQYVYINIYDHFAKAGNYDVIIDISVFSYAGQQLNGANIKAAITVK